VIFMPQYGMSDATPSKPFFALKHAYEFYQHVCNMHFLNPKKRCKLFGNTLTGTAASCWDQVTQDHIAVAAFVATLAYFKMRLQEWVGQLVMCPGCREQWGLRRSCGS